MMNIRNVTAGYDHDLFFKAICVYASTPVVKREPRLYKLKVRDTNLYLIHINEHEMAVTTNSKAAKVYELAGVSEAKEFAERQRVILQEEAPD